MFTGAKLDLAGSTPRARCGESGEGRLKAIIYTLILAAVVYTAVKLIPPYTAEYQLSDKIQEEARYAIANRDSEDKIRANVFKTIQELEIPVKAEDIQIVANQQFVKISVDYTVPVDLLFYHMDLHFTPSSKNNSIM
ncbi:MAG: hypothetical protein NVS9B4_18850 [Candidatus Acidiferrum sp.]